MAGRVIRQPGMEAGQTLNREDTIYRYIQSTPTSRSCNALTYRRTIGNESGEQRRTKHGVVVWDCLKHETRDRQQHCFARAVLLETEIWWNFLFNRILHAARDSAFFCDFWLCRERRTSCKTTGYSSSTRERAGTTRCHPASSTLGVERRLRR